MAGQEEHYLKDIAVVTGATLIKNDDLLNSLKEVKFSDFGSAQKVIIDEENTQIIGGEGSQSEIEAHLASIVKYISSEESKNSRKIAQERLTRLNQIQATIYVGGTGEAEQGENRDLIVDALNSARAALESGILPGGGSAMFHASRLLEMVTEVNEDEKVGVKVFKEAMEQPIRNIVGNSIGEEHVGHILEKIVDNMK
jgi:chaperonin GroEL